MGLLGESCAGPGTGLSDPSEPIPAQDIPRFCAHDPREISAVLGIIRITKEIPLPCSAIDAKPGFCLVLPLQATKGSLDI